MNPLLEVTHLSYSYHTSGGETYALSDLSFQVEKGEFIAIVGPSGCGKSTLLSLISGLLRPQSGEIRLDGKDVDEKRAGIGYMFQKDQLLEWRTIYKNVILGLEITHKQNPENLERVNKMLTDYGLAPFRDAKPSQLSGGMRQRAALIRTLAGNPQLLLLDEPFSALDALTRISVSDDIYRIIKKEQITALLITHDLSEAISMADRVIVLTARPAKIKTILPISLNLEERTVLLSRSDPQFEQYFQILWKELNA